MSEPFDTVTLTSVERQSYRVSSGDRIKHGTYDKGRKGGGAMERGTEGCKKGAETGKKGKAVGDEASIIQSGDESKA